MEKVAIYIRESDHKEAQVFAARQEEKLKAFCEAKGERDRENSYGFFEQSGANDE